MKLALILIIFCILAILNALSHNTLTEAVLLGKSHKPGHVKSKLYLVRFDKYILNRLLF